MERRSAWLREYLAAFNSGDVETLAGTLDRLYSDDLAAGLGGNEAAAAFRMETFRTAGPLEFAPVPPTPSPAIIWTRGRISGAWLGHQIEFDPAGAARRHTLWRVRPPGAPPAAPVPAQNLASALHSYLGRMAAAGLFSGAVELRHQGRTLLSEAYGRIDVAREGAFERETPSMIASVTKLFTVAAALRLVEAGVISLDDTVQRWIPEYPEPAASRTTVRHLLTHTAGIAFDDDPLYIADALRARTAEDLLRAQLASAARVGFQEFGAYKYSSEQIDLVGIVMERASGRRWTEIVQDHVLRPAGMTHTSFSAPPRHAVGYTFSTADLNTTTPWMRRATELLPEIAKPSGHAWSTATDLARLAAALVEGRLLGPEMTRRLLHPEQRAEEFPLFQLSSWVGLGSQGGDDFGVRTVGHGGVFPGYSAVIEIFPATDHVLTIVSNTGEHSAYLVYQRVLEMIYGVPRTEVPGLDLSAGTDGLGPG